ncbi:DNA segregation ATPase FtsK/SpoIIIE, S-DNA-T family [Arcanobacterium phocae]|uniref:DNA segregation ATPase FtsK/SpoIIIE, S-DNA-T family n=1 Tax=Arcanobacterium phocae TaxID=131112 RepID=A0A1H2LCW1_9ACTO|nr:FtsK/SpoIIIE domain-containing protein [Arcanobacterium phocae]SDU78575.1 DNA segregation ATPase FtsK/SpoIIIE, S-DNA-T family [Arcanobacterium phocae]
MRIVIGQSNNEHVYFASNMDQETTLHEIIFTSGNDVRDFEEIWVDGIASSLSQTVKEAHLYEGSTITNYPTLGGSVTTASPSLESQWELRCIGGLSSTESYPLCAGQVLRIGRSDQADITLHSASVSWSHAVLSIDERGVWIADDSSSNGTFVDGQRINTESTEPILLTEGSILGLGGICLILQRPQPVPTQPDLPYTAGGLIAFNRPPRVALPPHSEPVSVPVKKDSQGKAHFSWISVLAPLFMAMGMVAVMGSARYALIALLSPVMAVGSWLEQKRRNKDNEKENEENYCRDLEITRQEIIDASEAERVRDRLQTPYPHELIETVQHATPALWQVRASDEDFLTATMGTTNREFTPLRKSYSGQLQARTQEVFDEATIFATPQIVDLCKGPVGIWGPRESSMALARSLLCQLATSSGPGDYRVVVLTDKARSEDWRFTAWLPHTQTGNTNPHERFIALDSTQATTMARMLRDQLNQPEADAMLLVVDDISLLQGRDCPVRDILEYDRNVNQQRRRKRPVTAIILAAQANELPSICHSVIEVKYDNDATLMIPSQAKTTESITISGISASEAQEWSRMLARFDDPNASAGGGGLPSLVHLFDLLGFNRSTIDGSTITKSWDSFDGYNVPLGVYEDGIYTFDLVKDGPHGLVGGTTGSGKSELLRSLVAGLAAKIDPEHLTFILIDFKGGAAFASLDQLPHTIGTLSNLESSLAYRALKALEAELAWRQKCFSEAGENVDNIDAYLATRPAQPMPRLLVVVDEFAQLAKEYPDVLTSLVSIGAVGRTLGVHMILATQRPAGVVNDDILANTNMRAALRVQSREDSSNVIGVPLAASIGRNQRGRAYIKLGEEDITPIQTALVTGVSGIKQTNDLFVDPMILGMPPQDHTVTTSTDSNNDMEVLIEAIKEANKKKGFKPARKVWPDPLEEHVRLRLEHALDDDEHAQLQEIRADNRAKSVIQVGLYDDPDHQQQYVSGWDISDGNLVIAGIPGSGTSSALVSLALRIADTYAPDEADILVLDAGTSSLSALEELSHVRGFAGAGTANRELQTRLLRYLHNELEKRTADSQQKYPKVFVLIDGLTVLKEEYNDIDGTQLLEQFYRVWAKGPALGIHCAATTNRLKALPTAINEITSQKWLFRLADSYDYSLAEIARDNHPAPLPGRYVDALRSHQAHIGLAQDAQRSIEEINKSWGLEYAHRPLLVQKLPTFVEPTLLADYARIGTEPWNIPIGMSEADLQPHMLHAYGGEHVLIAGPARSGKSTMLGAIRSVFAAAAKKNNIDLTIFTVASRRSTLHTLFDDVREHDEISAVVASAQALSGPCVILIDDGHLVTDSDQSLFSLIKKSDPRILIVVTGRNEDLRNMYDNWIKELRKSRLGVLLAPNVDFDGPLLGAQIPRRSPVNLSIGRGYACQNGVVSLIQAATLWKDQ